jgi:hypothetical protein
VLPHRLIGVVNSLFSFIPQKSSLPVTLSITLSTSLRLLLSQTPLLSSELNRITSIFIRTETYYSKMPSNFVVSKETRRAPKFASIPSLHKVLAPFCQSFWATGLVIRCYTRILSDILDENTQLAIRHETCKAQYWQALLECLRDPISKDSRDLESLQVAQVLARYKPDEIIQELAAKSECLYSSNFEKRENKGEAYSTVFTGHKWLHDTARRGAPRDLSRADKASLPENLHFLNALQPMYTCPELHYLTPENLKTFGKHGVIMPTLFANQSKREELEAGLGAFGHISLRCTRHTRSLQY